MDSNHNIQLQICMDLKGKLGLTWWNEDDAVDVDDAANVDNAWSVGDWEIVRVWKRGEGEIECGSVCKEKMKMKSECY